MKTRNDAINECKFWIKDWWAEWCPYGIKWIIKRLNKLKVCTQELQAKKTK
jgi:hypothetical protein